MVRGLVAPAIAAKRASSARRAVNSLHSIRFAVEIRPLKELSCRTYTRWMPSGLAMCGGACRNSRDNSPYIAALSPIPRARVTTTAQV